MQGVGVWGMTIFKQFVCQQWAIPSNSIRSLRSSFSNSCPKVWPKVFRFSDFSDFPTRDQRVRVFVLKITWWKRRRKKFKISKKNYSEIYHDLQGLVCDKRKKRSWLFPALNFKRVRVGMRVRARVRYRCRSCRSQSHDRIFYWCHSTCDIAQMYRLLGALVLLSVSSFRAEGVQERLWLFIYDLSIRIVGYNHGQ